MIQQSEVLMSMATKERDIIAYTKRQLEDTVIAMQTMMVLLEDPLSTGQDIAMLRSAHPQCSMHTTFLLASVPLSRSLNLFLFFSGQEGEAGK